MKRLIAVFIVTSLASLAFGQVPAAAESGPDLSITQLVSSDPVPAGSSLTYMLTVSNTGSGEATNTSVSDSLPSAASPPGAIFRSATPSQGSCSWTAILTCSLGTVAAGGSATVDISLTTMAPGSISNTASVASDQIDPTPGDDSTTLGITVQAVPGTVYITATDSSYSPRIMTFGLGTNVQWDFYGPTSCEIMTVQHSALFDSGLLTAPAIFSFYVTAASKYKYICPPFTNSHYGLFFANVVLSPLRGTTSTVFTVTWSIAPPPAGFVFDVQIRRPGSVTSVPFLTGTRMMSTTFLPDVGPGTYSFTARVRTDIPHDEKGWSTPRGIRVS